MKKNILLIAISLIGVFTSCSSDEEIEISKTVNFTVNPATVASAFSAAEVNAGDMESFHKDCRLKVELFIYGSEGTLVKKFSQSFSNYAVQMKESSFIPQGEYTAVAITHIDDVVDNIQYWIITGEDKLEGLRVKDGGYIGGANKVLGISKQKFIVNENTEDIYINVQPAGSVMLVFYRNIHVLESLGISNYSLLVNKTMDYLEFDRTGTTNVVADNHNGSYDWIFDQLSSTTNYSSTNIYSYEFSLPMTNVGFQFRAYDDNYYYVLGKTTFNTEAGKSYYALLSLDSDPSKVEASFGTLTDSSSSREMSLAFAKVKEESMARSLFSKQSAKVVDLVK